MAENEGKSKGSMLAAVQSAQTAVGSALTGGTMAMAGAGASGGADTIPLLEDLRAIGKENERNTQSFMETLKAMFAFDREKFARERDQARELRKEKKDAVISGEPAKGISGEDLTGGFGAKGLAAIAGLAVFAKQMGMDTDILKLPQQIKSIKGMATFAKGVGSVATLGMGPKVVDDMKAALKATKINPKSVQQSMDLFDDAVKTRSTSFFGKGGILSTSYTKTLDSVADSFKTFKTSITSNRAFVTIADNFKEAKTTLQATFKPVKDALTGSGGLFASAKNGGALAKMIEPLKAIGKTIGKLFLPITLVLGIFDGYTGFMEEYEKEQSFMDGIRGAITGIIDGFIGSFVRLATGAIGKGLEYLGLENVGKFIADFGEDITASFKKTVGGLVDIVTGIFTLDLDRILGGIGATMAGLGNFLFDIVSFPINSAVNFVKDLFGFGNPDEPFNLKDFFFGEEGPIMSAYNYIKDLFTFDFQNFKQKLFNMGTILKGLGAGGIAAAKSILPGGESPGEAFKRVFDSYVKGNEVEPEPLEGDNQLAKTTATDIEGNTTETVYKTDTINNAGDNTNTNVTYVDNSNKMATNNAFAKSETYSGPLFTSSDPFFDRYSYNQT